MLSTFQTLRSTRALQLSIRLYSTNTSAEDLVYPESRSAHHHDLPSFLQYASRVDLDPTSTTYVGTHYEYNVLLSLERLGMSLKRIGGASDCGIDLLGTWSLPSVTRPLKVLVQCKTAYGGPAHIRELEGAFVGAPQGWKGKDVLGLLVSPISATKGYRDAIRRSRWPMGYIFCQANGKIVQMFWNYRAEQEGLEGVSCGVKYTGGGASEKEVVLTYEGKVLNN